MSARLSINVSSETSTVLREIAARRGMTVTEVVRCAVWVHKYLSDAQRDGHTLRMVDRHGDAERLVLL